MPHQELARKDSHHSTKVLHSDKMSCGQTSIPGVYLRGGSSKALFLKEHDIPLPGLLRDAVLKRLMGTPDPIQIDGMGGTRVVTSKIAIIKTSDREDADVEYTFAQVGIGEDTIRYSSNCGNISSGVGPFAIDECLIKKAFRKGITTDPKILAREVRIWQTGTKKLLIAHVPVDENTGKAVSKGDFAIAAVPGTGAPILMDFRTVSRFLTSPLMSVVSADSVNYLIRQWELFWEEGRFLAAMSPISWRLEGGMSKSPFATSPRSAYSCAQGTWGLLALKVPA